jgi:hypothetical protein
MSLTLTQGGDSVVLPSPDWQNSRSAIGSVRLHQSMDINTVYSYKKESVLKHLTYTISNIAYYLAFALQTFIIDHIADEITLTDQDGTIWTGRLLTDPISIVTEKPTCEIDRTTFTQEGTTITIDFEGTS